MRWPTLIVLTAEDPRTESLDDILAEMAAGVQKYDRREGVDFWRVPDRGEALRFAAKLGTSRGYCAGVRQGPRAEYVFRYG